MKFTNSDEDLERLNERQRIILASHRFAPPVTSAALWLNEQSDRNLVTCVQMTPYRDRGSGSLYLLANTIIPVPGADMYFIGLRDRTDVDSESKSSTNMRQTDELTRFCEKISDMVTANLADNLKPNRTSRWAGGQDNWRYYHFWYSGPSRRKLPPWGNWDMFYQLEFFPHDSAGGKRTWGTSVGIGYQSIDDELKRRLNALKVAEELEKNDNYMWAWYEEDALTEEYCAELSSTLCELIKAITPVVREYIDDDE